MEHNLSVQVLGKGTLLRSGSHKYRIMDMRIGEFSYSVDLTIQVPEAISRSYNSSYVSKEGSAIVNWREQEPNELTMTRVPYGWVSRQDAPWQRAEDWAIKTRSTPHEDPKLVYQSMPMDRCGAYMYHMIYWPVAQDDKSASPLGVEVLTSKHLYHLDGLEFLHPDRRMSELLLEEKPWLPIKEYLNLTRSVLRVKGVYLPRIDAVDGHLEACLKLHRFALWYTAAYLAPGKQGFQLDDYVHQRDHTGFRCIKTPLFLSEWE
jgi:hypothetical protein